MYEPWPSLTGALPLLPLLLEADTMALPCKIHDAVPFWKEGSCRMTRDSATMQQQQR